MRGAPWASAVVCFAHIMTTVTASSTKGDLSFEGLYFSGTGANTSYLELLDVAKRMISSSDTEYMTPTGVLDQVRLVTTA